jgi:hypothetical protein
MTREWQSPEGRRWIEGSTPDGRLLVRTEGLAFAQILPVSELDREIHRDESNAKSRLASRERIDRERAAEAETLTEKRGLHGFTEGMPSVKARKIEAALDKQQMFNGKIMKRRDFIEQSVADGAVVGLWHDKRVLQFPSESFMTERDVTSTALDYAEFLTGTRTPMLRSKHRRQP